MAAAIDYRSRPAKSVERHLIIEVFRRLAPFGPLDQYSYVGFGAVEGVDMSLLHRELGIKKLTSIEHDTPNAERYRFNRPLDYVTLQFGSATDVLPTLEWDGLTLVWLDFESSLTEAALRDCEDVMRRLVPGSVLVATVNCNIGVEGRLESIRKNLGGVETGFLREEDVAGRWGVANAQGRILRQHVEDAVTGRHDGTKLEQLLNLQYRDGARMQTLAWLVSTPALDQTVSGQCRFEELSFVRDGEAALELSVPLVTQRERLALEAEASSLPSATLPWIGDDEQVAFASYHRWYPVAM
jgi:hypothetical protein